MTKIILVKNLDETNYKKLELELANSSLTFRISLANKAVIIDGDNDDAYNAKTIIRECGFVIE